MFRKSEGRRRGGFFPLVLFRLTLSLAMFLVLGLVLYQAFRYFSGASLEGNLLTTDPRVTLNKILASDKTPEAILTILGVSFNGLKDSINNPSSPTISSPNLINRNHPSNAPLNFRFALIADSHNDNKNLAQALRMAKDRGAKFVIGLGDYTATGTLAELEQAKNTFQASGLPYYLTAGDHDLWDSRDKTPSALTNFNQVFGSPYESFVDSNVRFVIVYNSDNYQGLDSFQMSWIRETLTQRDLNKEKVTYILLHEPLSHPSSDRVMGSPRKTADIADASSGSKQILLQAEELKGLFKTQGVAEVFAGDIHAFTRYEDKDIGLKMTTVGAVTAERNLQLPRFAMVDVLVDGSYNIQDLEIR